MRFSDFQYLKYAKTLLSELRSTSALIQRDQVKEWDSRLADIVGNKLERLLSIVMYRR